MSDDGLERAKALAAFCEAARPAALRLARLLSPAVRVEPALVRRARLKLAPELDAGAESDFWFSPLVGSRSSEAVVLDRDVARLLRQELAADPELLERARAVVAAAHVGEPAALRLEEEIVYLSLRGAGEAEIEERLRPALRALVAGSEGALQVSRWADRAVAGLPPGARASEPVRLLALGAAARLAPHAQVARELGRMRFPSDGSWVLPSPSPSAAGETRLAVRLRPGALEFAEASGDAPAITLPAGSPPMVEVAWEVDGEETRIVAGIRSVVTLPDGVGEVRIRTAAGAEYRVTPMRTADPATAPETRGPAETDEILVYLSYAVRDGGPEVDSLARDLARELTRRLDRPVRCVGTASRDLELEQSVREELARDLFRSHALVALVTNTYLNSEWCGRELAGFRARMESAGASEARLLVPVLWTGRVHFPLPPILRDVQWLKLPEQSDEGGLKGLIGRIETIKPSAAEYGNVLGRFATTLAGALSEVRLPPVAEPPALTEIPSAFTDVQETRAPEEQMPEQQAPQPQSNSGDHPDTRKMDELAGRLAEQGDFVGARKLAEQVLETRVRVLGEEHPDTLVSMSNLANRLFDQGDPAGARALNERVLEIRRRVQGEEHPDTLGSMDNLATSLSALGDLAAARELAERVLEIRRRVLGEEHPDTLTSLSNIANSLSEHGDFTNAHKLNERVLQIRRRILGDEHPDTLGSMDNLATSLSDLGDPAAARELAERVLEIRRRVLGEEHPDTLTSMSNLADRLSDQGDLAGARRLYEQVAESRRRVLGEKHPDTLSSLSSLVALMDEHGGEGLRSDRRGK